MYRRKHRNKSWENIQRDGKRMTVPYNINRTVSQDLGKGQPNAQPWRFTVSDRVQNSQQQKYKSYHCWFKGDEKEESSFPEREKEKPVFEFRHKFVRRAW